MQTILLLIPKYEKGKKLQESYDKRRHTHVEIIFRRAQVFSKKRIKYNKNKKFFYMQYGSGVIRCTLFIVLYLRRMCQCGLLAVLWSYIGILMRLFDAEPRSTAGLFPLSVTMERSC